MKVLKSILFTAACLFMYTNANFAATTPCGGPDCAEIKKDIKKMFSGIVNHPTTRKRLTRMSKQDARTFKTALRNRLNALYGQECAPKSKYAPKVDCSNLQKECRFLFSSTVNHPQTRKQLSRMSKQEKHAFRKGLQTKLNERYGSNCTVDLLTDESLNIITVNDSAYEATWGAISLDALLLDPRFTVYSE